MSHINQINKTMGLLSQALNIAGGSLNQTVSSAKTDIRKAIEKLESVKKDHLKKQIQQETNHEKWWSKIKAGVILTTASSQTQMKNLKELNKLITVEQDKIDEFENKIKIQDSQILKD